jgi:hypothetical protein
MGMATAQAHEAHAAIAMRKTAVFTTEIVADAGAGKIIY